MGFLSGRVSFVRYKVSGRAPKSFGPEHLERLAAHAIGKQRVVSADGIEVGWTAGDHILDTRFDLAKNVVNDALVFMLRVDAHKVPGDLLRAYTQVELEGLAAGNPSGFPSTRQKREARQLARERLEKEASDGRFLRRKAYPVLWDALSNELLFGATATTAADRLHTLFQQTFERSFERLGAGQLAWHLAEARQQTRGIDDAEPAVFVPGVTPPEVAWLPDPASRDFLGNEFLLWLWYALDDRSDTVALSDGSAVTAMFARSLVLECPRGQTGRESIRSDGPARLPEARRAVQAGKLPRQAGLTLVRHDRQYDLTLHAESLAVTGARLPAAEEEEERARLEERVTTLRHLIETLDLLYDAFGQLRTGAGWAKELGRLQAWLQRDDRARRSATG
ncbi:MAG TPA: hypothetical protein VFA26_06945 [Gemmataceae bacterium]|nr:hypothetical protein [Gemmataceae bacterium]